MLRVEAGKREYLNWTLVGHNSVSRPDTTNEPCDCHRAREIICENKTQGTPGSALMLQMAWLV